MRAQPVVVLAGIILVRVVLRSMPMVCMLGGRGGGGHGPVMRMWQHEMEIEDPEHECRAPAAR